MKPVLRANVLACALTLGVALGAAMAQTGPAEWPGARVQDLLTLARSNNPEYASMRYEAQAAQERIMPAGALPDPRLRTELMDITRGGTQNPTLLPSNAGSVRLTLMQDVPWFGKRGLKTDMASLEAQASQSRAQATWFELAARIKTAQAQRYYLHGNQQLAQEILDLMTQLERVAQTRYANGLTQQQDVIRAQVEQTTMRSELVNMQSDIAQLDARLNGWLARDAQAPLALPDAPNLMPVATKLDSASLAERVRQRNPQLFSEQARAQAAEKNRDLSLRNRYPDFNFGLSPTVAQGGGTEWALMVELNIPLQQGSRRAQEREAQAMLDAARARTEALANQVLADLAQNQAALEAAQRTEQLVTHSLLPQAELTLRSAMAAYENGKLDFATLLDAQRQVRQARQSQLKARFEAQMRLAEIEKLTGEDV